MIRCSTSIFQVLVDSELSLCPQFDSLLGLVCNDESATRESIGSIWLAPNPCSISVLSCYRRNDSGRMFAVPSRILLWSHGSVAESRTGALKNVAFYVALIVVKTGIIMSLTLVVN